MNGRLLILLGLILACSASLEVLAIDLPKPKPKKDPAPTKSDPSTTPAKSDPAATPAKDPAPADTAKPADPKPAEPAAQPTTEIPITKEAWEQMYKDWKAGDYVVYEMTAAPGMKQRQEVIEATADSVTVVSTIEMNGQKQPGGKMKYVVKAETKTAEDKVKVGDKEISATRTEVYNSGKLAGKTWTSKEVPLGGMVRSEGDDGKASMNLVEFGRGK